MELTTSLFRAYFKKKISLETLIEKTGIYESEFSNCLLQEMIIAFDSKDAERIGYLIYTLCLWDELVGKNKFHEFEKFVDILNKLLLFPAFTTGDQHDKRLLGVSIMHSVFLVSSYFHY